VDEMASSAARKHVPLPVAPSYPDDDLEMQTAIEMEVRTARQPLAQQQFSHVHLSVLSVLPSIPHQGLLRESEESRNH